MKIKMDDIETSGSVIYDPGAYVVSIKDIESVQSKNGNEQLRVKTTFIGGDYDGKQITDHITLVPTVAWKLKSFLESFGINTDGVELDTDSMSFRNMLNKLYGRTAVWIVGTQTRDGVTRNVVNAYKPDPDAKPQEDETKGWLE